MKCKMVAAMVAVVALAVIFISMPIDEADAAGEATFSVDGTVGTWAEVRESVKDGSNIVVQSSGTFSNTINISASEVVLDLNGKSIDFAPTNNGTVYAAINVQSGASLRIVDSGSEKGMITTAMNEILLDNRGSMELNGVSVSLNYNGDIDRMVQNVSEMIISNSTLSCSSTNIRDDNALVNFKNLTIENSKIVSNTTAVYNGYLEFGNVTCDISNTEIITGSYGVAAFGKGIDDGSPLDNNSVVVTMTNSSLLVNNKGGQGICTNANGGKNAGHTITLNNVDINAPDEGCGIYAPSLGIYNINGGSIYGQGQGIRISAGELNIYGGAEIRANSISTIKEGLVAGGSGGASGAIVIGKAGNGYVGDIDINIDDATISNGSGDAVVYSDVYMGSYYSENSIDFDFENGEIYGNIQNITSSTQSLEGDPISDENAKPSNGNASFRFNGGTIFGDVIQSSEGCSTDLNGTTVSGNVLQENEDGPQISITGGMIMGNVPETVSPAGIVTLVSMGKSMSFPYYGDSITLLDIADEPGFTIGWSTDNKTIQYECGEKITGISGNITLYLVIIPDNQQIEPSPGYDDDEDLPPFIPTQSAEDDDTVTIVACAAAAALAAIMAVFLIIDRKG